MRCCSPNPISGVSARQRPDTANIGRCLATGFFLGSDGRARAARARERRREPRDDARHCSGRCVKVVRSPRAAFRHPSATSSAVSGASRRCLLGFFRDGVWLPSVARSPALDAAALAFDAPTSTLPIKLTNDRLPCIVFAPTVSPVPHRGSPRPHGGRPRASGVPHEAVVPRRHPREVQVLVRGNYLPRDDTSAVESFVGRGAARGGVPGVGTGSTPRRIFSTRRFFRAQPALGSEGRTSDSPRPPSKP